MKDEGERKKEKEKRRERRRKEKEKRREGMRKEKRRRKEKGKRRGRRRQEKGKRRGGRRRASLAQVLISWPGILEITLATNASVMRPGERAGVVGGSQDGRSFPSLTFHTFFFLFFLIDLFLLTFHTFFFLFFLIDLFLLTFHTFFCFFLIDLFLLLIFSCLILFPYFRDLVYCLIVFVFWCFLFSSHSTTLLSSSPTPFSSSLSPASSSLSSPLLFRLLFHLFSPNSSLLIPLFIHLLHLLLLHSIHPYLPFILFSFSFLSLHLQLNDLLHFHIISAFSKKSQRFP